MVWQLNLLLAGHCLVRRSVAVDLLAYMSTSALATWVIRSHSGSRRPPQIECSLSSIPTDEYPLASVAVTQPLSNKE